MKQFDIHPSWAEGPPVLPAQGNALGNGLSRHVSVGPKGQPFSSKGELLARWAGMFLGFHSPQGVAPGWANGRPFGASQQTAKL